MAPSGLEVFAADVGLFVALVPLGISLTWAFERAARRRWHLSLVERLVVGFYAAGALCFVLASVPLPLFGLPLVLGIIVVGIVGAFLIAVGAETPRLFAAVREAERWSFWVVVGLVLGLLGFIVATVGTNLLPNTFDGSVQVLFVRLLLDNHTVPTTLAPYAQAGVIYPQGTAVWLSFAPLLFAWPLTSAPVGLPALFLGLSVAGAYSWGERWGGFRTPTGRRTGLVFALGFAVLLTWPRFLVGGSYDFVFAVPLLFVLLGLLPEFVASRQPPMADVVAVGLVVGTLFSLSVAAGEAAVLILVGFLLVFQPRLRKEVRRWALRVGVVVALAAAFLTRSLVGIAVWFSYPGHVMTELGSPPYAPAPPGLAFGPGEILGELDPFQLAGPKLSPLAGINFVLAGLLLAGVLLILFGYGPFREELERYLPRGLAGPVVVGTVVMLLLTAVLLVGTAPGSAVGWIGGVTSLDETSILLFIFFQAVALVSLVVAVEVVVSPGAGPRSPTSVPESGAQDSSRPGSIRKRRRGNPWTGIRVVAAVTLLIVFGAGFAGTAVSAPQFLHTVTTRLANVTTADLEALAWAGSHLPACARVLVAPGSAAQFLPAYAVVGLVYPMNPAPLNLSYSIAVTNLSAGNYTLGVRTALLDLGITDVFVTGASSFLFKPFLPGPLEHSTDFGPLFAEGDAYVFAFLPNTAAAACDG